MKYNVGDLIKIKANTNKIGGKWRTVEKALSRWSKKTPEYFMNEPDDDYIATKKTFELNPNLNKKRVSQPLKNTLVLQKPSLLNVLCYKVTKSFLASSKIFKNSKSEVSHYFLHNSEVNLY